MFAFSAKPDGRFLLGLGKGGSTQAGEHQAPLVMGLRLAGVDAHGLIEESQSRFEPAAADFQLPAFDQGLEIRGSSFMARSRLRMAPCSSPRSMAMTPRP